MGKIISQTLEVEAVHEPTQELEDVVYFEMRNAAVNERVSELTSVGYDNEIGLWEEREHRNRSSKIYAE